MAVADGVLVHVAVAEAAAVGLAVAVPVGDGVGDTGAFTDRVADGDAVAVAVGMAVAVAVGVAVALAVGVRVAVAVGVRVGVRLGVEVAVGDFVGVRVAVAVGAFVGVRVAVAVGCLVGVRVAVGGFVGVEVGDRAAFVAVGVGPRGTVVVAVGVAVFGATEATVADAFGVATAALVGDGAVAGDCTGRGVAVTVAEEGGLVPVVTGVVCRVTVGSRVPDDFVAVGAMGEAAAFVAATVGAGGAAVGETSWIVAAGLPDDSVVPSGGASGVSPGDCGVSAGGCSGVSAGGGALVGTANVETAVCVASKPGVS